MYIAEKVVQIMQSFFFLRNEGRFIAESLHTGQFFVVSPIKVFKIYQVQKRHMDYHMPFENYTSRLPSMAR